MGTVPTSEVMGGGDIRTYGMISSSEPLRKRRGRFGGRVWIVSSVGQIWWHRGARYFAGGNALFGGGTDC